MLKTISASLINNVCPIQAYSAKTAIKVHFPVFIAIAVRVHSRLALVKVSVDVTALQIALTQ